MTTCDAIHWGYELSDGADYWVCVGGGGGSSFCGLVNWLAQQLSSFRISSIVLTFLCLFFTLRKMAQIITHHRAGRRWTHRMLAFDFLINYSIMVILPRSWPLDGMG